MILLNVVKNKKEELCVLPLSNGMTMVHRYNKSPLAHCGLLIKAGTRHELKDESGLAHFTEHMIFKGTRRHTAKYILSRIDDMGGELNAYTSRENTIVHATSFRQNSRKTVELLFEIVFESTFPEKEIKKEVEVITDEIHSYKDSPTDALLDEFDELITGGHPIGRNILGTPESVSSFKREHFIRFTSDLYNPDRMIFFFSGQVKPDVIAGWINALLAGRPFASSSGRNKYPPIFHRFHIVRRHPNNQCIAAMGTLAPGVHHADYPTLALLNHLLGGPTLNNILNLNIREKYGLTYEIESFLNPYSDCAFMGIYFGTDKASMKKVFKRINVELQKLMDQPIPERKLMKARIQFMGHYLIQQDNALNHIINAARSYELFLKTESPEYIWQKLSDIKASDIQEAAGRYLNPDNLSTLIFESE